MQSLCAKIPEDISTKMTEELLKLYKKTNSFGIRDAIAKELTGRGYYKEQKIQNYYKKIAGLSAAELKRRKAKFVELGKDDFADEITAIERIPKKA